MKAFTGLEGNMVARINVTPIIDVALVLVIILLVTAPILAALDLGINLPQARTRGADDDHTLCVTMGKNGELAIGEERVSRRDFARRMSERLQETPDEEMFVVVRADAASPHAEVRELILAIKDAGATHIGIGTRQKSEDGR